MKAATIQELKKEMQHLDRNQLLTMCLRLARFKKDNKELLTYLLFESANEESYIQSIKNGLNEQMATVRKPGIYFTKKGLRRVLRQLDKFIRYSGNKETEAELRIYFCQQMKVHNIPVNRYRMLTNLYEGQLKKIKTAISKLHEDLQYDFEEQLRLL